MSDTDSEKKLLFPKRLLLEGLVIVASILLAFAIDAWWGEREEEEHRRQVLEGLLVETRQNLATLEGALAYRSRLDEATEELFGWSLLGVPADVSTDSLDTMILAAGWYETAALGTATLDAVIQSGDLRLVRSDTLLQTLTAWREIVRAARNVVEADRGLTLGPYSTLIREQGEFSQIFSRTPPAMVQGYPLPDFQAAAEPFDHRGMVRRRDFRNLIAERRSTSADMSYIYRTFLIPAAAQLETLLAAELGLS